MSSSTPPTRLNCKHVNWAICILCSAIMAWPSRHTTKRNVTSMSIRRGSITRVHWKWPHWLRSCKARPTGKRTTTWKRRLLPIWIFASNWDYCPTLFSMEDTKLHCIFVSFLTQTSRVRYESNASQRWVSPCGKTVQRSRQAIGSLDNARPGSSIGPVARTSRLFISNGSTSAASKIRLSHCARRPSVLKVWSTQTRFPLLQTSLSSVRESRMESGRRSHSIYDWQTGGHIEEIGRS